MQIKIRTWRLAESPGHTARLVSKKIKRTLSMKVISINCPTYRSEVCNKTGPTDSLQKVIEPGVAAEEGPGMLALGGGG